VGSKSKNKKLKKQLQSSQEINDKKSTHLLAWVIVILTVAFVLVIRFRFDNQILAQILWRGYTIAEITCPTVYAADSSSNSVRRSVNYGIGCIATALIFFLSKRKLIKSRLLVNNA
jgi:hypothetical protein